MVRASTLLGTAVWLGAAHAHLAAFHKGMYCINGPSNTPDLNSYAIVYPLYQLNFNDWWFHHVNGCDQYPPADGDFLEIPAGGTFTVEIASNRGKTSLSFNGQYTSEWPDGSTYPEDYNVPSCIISPNMHAQNQSRAAGTAFAISYHSDIKQVTPDNLAVFTVRYNTPWKRILTYDVPANMPACPAGGCICAWGWVPNGCGQPNMYHQPFKCKVTGAKSTTPVAAPKPPVWCEGNPGGCTKGAKQMIAWNQLSGNNIAVSGWDQNGDPKSPAYNSKCGFADGAQNDIFAGAPSSGGSNSDSGNSNTGSSSSGGSSSGGSGSGSGSGSSGSSGSSGGAGSNTPGATPATPGSSNPVTTPTVTTAADGTVTTLPASPNTPVNPPVKNPAPSCKKRKRGLASTSLAKKSSLARDFIPAAHRRRNAHAGVF